jgi:hypothetical protein
MTISRGFSDVAPGVMPEMAPWVSNVWHNGWEVECMIFLAQLRDWLIDIMTR